MSTLHLLNASPFTGKQFANALFFAAKEDAILLTGDATYALQQGSDAYQTLQKTPLPIYVLEEDMITRAIKNSLENVRIIDYPEFVALCSRYNKVMSWL